MRHLANFYNVVDSTCMLIFIDDIDNLIVHENLNRYILEDINLL